MFRDKLTHIFSMYSNNITLSNNLVNFIRNSKISEDLGTILITYVQTTDGPHKGPEKRCIGENCTV